MRKRENSYTFHLDWQGEREATPRLKIKCTFNNAFHPAAEGVSPFSWVMPQATLLNFPHYADYDISSNQGYYKIEVFEGIIHQHNIINMWTTSDGQLGELRDVAKGSPAMPGNEVLNVFKYLMLLLRISQLFIFDESSIGEAKIPLRLFLPFLIEGKTWYEGKLDGLELFECEDFVTHGAIVTQNKQKRAQALSDLRRLPLNQLYVTFNSEDQQALLNLCKQHLPEKLLRTRRSPRLQKLASIYESNSFFTGNAVLQELVAAVYGDSRKQRTVTDSLKILNTLLSRGLGHVSVTDDLETRISQTWVAGRVEQLLTGSNFWMRTEAFAGHERLPDCRPATMTMKK